MQAFVVYKGSDSREVCQLPGNESGVYLKGDLTSRHGRTEVDETESLGARGLCDSGWMKDIERILIAEPSKRILYKMMK